MPLAIIKPAATVTIFWTIIVRVSPTRVLTIEASTDNLAPIAPLKKNYTNMFRIIKELCANISHLEFSRSSNQLISWCIAF